MRRIALRAFLVAALIVVGFVFGGCRQEQAQTQVAQFHFTIQRTETGVKMQCQQGCAWTDLSFTLSGDRTQAVDGMGMADK